LRFVRRRLRGFVVLVTIRGGLAILGVPFVVLTLTHLKFSPDGLAIKVCAMDLGLFSRLLGAICLRSAINGQAAVATGGKY
jgi:hypothetical protein